MSEEKEKNPSCDLPDPNSPNGLVLSVLKTILDFCIGADSWKEVSLRLSMLTLLIFVIAPGSYILFKARDRLADYWLPTPEIYKRQLEANYSKLTLVLQPLLTTLKEDTGSSAIAYWAYSGGLASLQRRLIYQTNPEYFIDKPTKSTIALLDAELLLHMMKGECAYTNLLDKSSKPHWSKVWQSFMRRNGLTVAIECPVVRGQDLNGYISVYWTQEAWSRLNSEKHLGRNELTGLINTTIAALQ